MPEHQLDSLNLAAALLALNPLDQAVIRLDPDSVAHVSDRSVIDGVPCDSLCETSSGSTAIHTFWIDPQRDFVVRRYTGQYGSRSTHIDISSAGKELSRFGAFVRSSVTVRHPTADSPVPACHLTALSKGSWVIDERSNQQYLIRYDGTRRRVKDEELIWQPTYDDLLRTETGDVRALLVARLQWHSLRSRFTTLIIATAFLATGLLLLLLKRHFSTVRSRADSSTTSNGNTT